MASRRNYVTNTEVDEMAGITSTDIQISEAEEIIDAYVGYQEKFFEHKLEGRATAGGNSTLTLETKEANIHEADYFKWCEIEILGGTGAGQRRTILSSTKAGVITVQSAWDTAPDNTSFYIIYQLGKFPRECDVVYYSESQPYSYYKQIPEAVKRATAAQVEYMINLGDDFFASDKADKQSESIGDYSYSNVEGAANINKLIAPKARALLRGIINRTGAIIV